MKEPLPTGAAILMAGAAPVARRPPHEKVNGCGLRSERMDMTGSSIPAEWGFRCSASEEMAVPIRVSLFYGS